MGVEGGTLGGGGGRYFRWGWRETLDGGGGRYFR